MSLAAIQKIIGVKERKWMWNYLAIFRCLKEEVSIQISRAMNVSKTTLTRERKEENS